MTQAGGNKQFPTGAKHSFQEEWTPELEQCHPHQSCVGGWSAPEAMCVHKGLTASEGQGRVDGDQWRQGPH